MGRRYVGVVQFVSVTINVVIVKVILGLIFFIFYFVKVLNSTHDGLKKS